MRMSLPPGTEIIGKNNIYIAENIVSISDRSTTAICRNSQSQRYRIKIFDGNSSINNESYKFFADVKTRGLLKLVDYGDISGNPYYIYGDYNVQDLSQHAVSIDLLVSRIIPQISYVIAQIHNKRYVIRDIAPEHVLFDDNAKEILFTGLSNYTKLQDRASATKETGYGQQYSYIAPEVEQYGYSTASDYFSLGVLLLSVLKGRNVIQNISRRDFVNGLMAGKVPGIDVSYLKNMSPNMYSTEDKVLYLILGLMISNPNQRWGYGEVKCWCNNQFIPLIQKGEKIKYQYSSPLILGGNKCWNDKQIADALSASSDIWTKDTYNKVCYYLINQRSQVSSAIERFGSDDSDKSRIFKIIYTLLPETDGFVWNGRRYKDTNEIVRAVKNNSLNSMEMREILRNGCFSYYHNCRNKLGITDNVDIQEIIKLEKLERFSTGEGVSRCMILFAPDKQSRYFEIEGKKYTNIHDLLSAYKRSGLRLKEISSQIIRDSTFQAWLWAKGYEQLGREALNNLKINEKNSFPILCTVIEKSVDNDADKKAIREVYVKFGDLAPVAWLIENVKYYRNVSQINSILYNRFNNARINLNRSIQELNQYLSGFVRDYQLFVQDTLDNPFVLEFGRDNSISPYNFQPMYESGFFCLRWNDSLEVCPEFIHSVNGSIDNGKIRNWLTSCGNKQREILNGLSNGIDTRDISGADEYLQKCDKNLTSAVVMLIIATILMLFGFKYYIGYSLLCYALAIIYPILSITWYHQKKVRAEIWYRTYKQQADMISSLDSLNKRILQRENDIFNRLTMHVNSKCIIQDVNSSVYSVVLEDPEVLDLSASQKIAAYASTFGFVLLTTVILGHIYSSGVAAFFYAVIYGIGIPYVFRRSQFVNSCFEWTVITCIVSGISIFGGMVVGNSFLSVMNWIPVGIIIAIIIFMFII